MSALTRWELGAYALSALLALSSLIVLPVVRAVDPVLACAINFSGDATLQARFIGMSGDITHTADPWGRPWRRDMSSLGPDGVDGDGHGDDVLLEMWLEQHPALDLTPKVVLARPRLTLILAGLVLALWTLLTHQMARAPRGRLRAEVLRAGLVAAVPASAAVLWVAVVPHFDHYIAEAGVGGFVQLPASVALPLTWALLCYLPALAWRLSRPRPEASLT